MTYSDLLRDPRWQRVRLEKMQSANWACELCGDPTTTLNVHHVRYVRGRMPWQYPDSELRCLCEPCHSRAHGLDTTEPSGPPPNGAPLHPSLARSRDHGPRLADRASSAERELVRVLLHRPSYLEIIVERVGCESFRSEIPRRVFAAMVALGPDPTVLTAHLDSEAVGLIEELLEVTAGLEHADEAIAGSLSAMHERDLAERARRIDCEIQTASVDQKSELEAKKREINDELRRMGGRWWKRARVLSPAE